MMYLKYGRLGMYPNRSTVRRDVIMADKTGELNSSDYRTIRKYIGYDKKKKTKFAKRSEWIEGILEDSGWIDTFEEKKKRGLSVKVTRRYVFPDPYELGRAKTKPISMKKYIEIVRKGIKEEKQKTS